MRRLIWVVIAVFFSVSMWSCRSKRSIYKAPIKEEGSSYLLTQLEDHELKYKTFAAKFSLHYADGKEKTSFRGNIRIKRDSLIWVSIAPVMGIEVARILITPDSVKIIDRTNKSYFMESYRYVNQYLNNALDFDMLQAFLIGNDFSFFEEANWKASIDGGLYKLATANRRKLRKYVRSHEATEIPIQNTWLDPNTFKIKKIMVKEIRPSRSRKLIAQYSDFFVVESQMLPLHMEFNVKANNNVNVLLDYSRVNLNDELRFPFRISSKYQELKLADPTE